MRHFLASLAIAAHPGGMRHTTAPAALVTAASLAQAGSSRGLRAVAIAVSLAAITTATDDDLRPATGAHVQAAWAAALAAPPERQREGAVEPSRRAA